MANDSQTSINIPQILAVAVVSFLAIRWWLSKPTTADASSSRSSRGAIDDPAKIDQVSSIARSSGDMTAEPARPDLITRYGLQGKVNDKGKGKEPVPSEEQKRKNASVWSSDKGVRAEGLRRRREEMILAARRKMLENEAASSS
ncbi:hypothetical protein AC578_5004 [Pseudocercospora eumusae]|uniref:CUE domain-containing protein n=1 Tax=Pseudocercospora eumusae TaxID=321146 RepID=A0A139H9C3_9PEZI|nr:hypothetical protein AC578_5004 [Pseudocercospora eumusae]